MRLPVTEILLVDGNTVDAGVAEDALQSGGFGRVRTVPDGDTALELLLSGSFIPDLIILDIGAPVTRGLEVVSRLKSDRRFRHVPLIVWVSPEDKATAGQAYERHANCVIDKPSDAGELNRSTTSIAGFWLHCAVFLRHRDGIAEAAARGNTIL